MAYTRPTEANFKNYFNRDFPYGETLEQVMDADITKALDSAELQINEEIAYSQADFTRLYLLLSAHNLVLNLRASSQGISGKYEWLTQSKGVGSVSFSAAIPQRILENPELAILADTNYGAQYLALVIPRLSGVMYGVCGGTHP